MQAPVRFAVVGLNHGIGHAMTILRNPRAELAALCDIDSQALAGARSAVAASQYAPANEVRGFADYADLLAWDEFDAVVIATPPAAHTAMTLAAMRQGKHVLVEKPLTHSPDEARALLDAEKTAGVVVQVGYEVRSSQLVAKCRELIDAGKIGEVVFVWWHMFLLDHRDHTNSWYGSRAQGGGKLIDCCCHYMDILGLLAGAPFYRLTAYGTAKGKIGRNPDEIAAVAAVIFEFENGAKGNLNLSEISPTPESSLFGIVGTNGIIYGNPWRPEGAGSLDCYTDGGLYREQITINGSMASAGHLGFTEQHDRFLDAILHGGPNPCTLADGVEVLFYTTAVDRSLTTGETILHADLARELAQVTAG